MWFSLTADPREKGSYPSDLAFGDVRENARPEDTIEKTRPLLGRD
jgi:hypothetical protein